MPEKIIKTTPPENDPVKHPNHYCYGKFECVEVIQELTAGASGPEGFLLGNVIKYLWRYRRKNGVEDLRKARRYIDMLIRLYEDPAPCEKGLAGQNKNDPGKNEPAAWENGRPIYNRTTAEAAARYTGQQGEFFDAVNGKRTPGRLGSINPDSPAPFTGLVCIGKDKYITMPYRFFSPLPETGADENPQEKPDA
jgi:hypothetical protein